MSVPILPLIYANGAARRRDNNNAVIAVATVGTNTGNAIPRPGTDSASQWVTAATQTIVVNPRPQRWFLTNR